MAEMSLADKYFVLTERGLPRVENTPHGMATFSIVAATWSCAVFGTSTGCRGGRLCRCRTGHNPVTGRGWGVGRFLLPLFFSTVFPAVVVRAQEAETVTAPEAILLQSGEAVPLVGVPTSDPYLANDRTENGLLPRGRSDLRFPLIIPFKTIAISTIITALVAMMCHLVLRRRVAERRERETTLLLERIVQAEKKHQQAEEALRLSAKIADNMAYGDYLIRVQDGQIVYADRGFEQMFGVPDLYIKSNNVPQRAR